MENKELRGTARGSAVAWMAPAIVALAVVGLPRAHATDQSRLPASFSGLLNDYTPPPPPPNMPAAPGVAGGPYEMHGKWSLQLNEARGTATFSAEMTMETADFANTDANHDPSKLAPHTHHLGVTDGVIHNDPADPINWQAQCPMFKPPVSHGFVVTGTAFVTGNGGNPPFGNPSPVTICILGGMQNPNLTGAQAFVELSNFTLTFGIGSRASTHFGTQAINGVITNCERPWNRNSSDCKIAIID
jgi:hypothetical protein